jgi:6,7-dimethyl-8-ribityllumazine synthase
MPGPHVLIVEARFYVELADHLVSGASAVLDAEGASYTREWVSGSFELPAAIRFAIEAQRSKDSARRFDGFIALGCVIEGETDHYDHICREASRGLMDLTLDYAAPLGFGVLTCRTYDQALERAAVDRKNKGADAARACLRMIELKRKLMQADA